MRIPQPQGMQWRQALLLGAWKDSRTLRALRRQASTGVGGPGDEPIGDSLGALVEGFAGSASVAADLTAVEDQGLV